MRSRSVKQIRVGVLGASGRMGQEIGRILAADEACEPFLAIEGGSASAGFKNTAKSLKTELAKDVDVWIDFSSPDAMAKLLPIAAANKTPVVSGTTGITTAQKNALKKAARTVPVLWASNMSLGVALLNEAIKLYGRLKGFDFQIEEIHHKRKKDRPSGTALTLQETLVAAVNADVPEPLALRGGGVFGVHKVWAFSEEEVLSFEHQALNRAVFARGAVQAAKWLVRQKPGMHTIQEVLNAD